MPEPTRYDLEFMAETIVVEMTCVGGLLGSDTRRRNLRMYDDAGLAEAIARRTSDPIANMRAQHKLAALAAQLPPH